MNSEQTRTYTGYTKKHRSEEITDAHTTTRGRIYTGDILRQLKEKLRLRKKEKRRYKTNTKKNEEE